MHPKKVFPLPLENKKGYLHHWILHISINLGTKLQLKRTILKFGTKFVWKRYFYSKRRKKSSPMLHIWISLVTKFQLKLTILIFFIILAQEGYFQSKIEKVNVVSCKWRSAVKKNRIMKLFFAIDMIGQLYGHVTLTMWKLSEKRISSFWKNAHEVERPPFLCLRIYTNFYGVLTSKYFMWSY